MDQQLNCSLRDWGFTGDVLVVLLSVHVVLTELCRAQDVGWSDRPIYTHTSHREFLFYLQSRSKGLWMIGPKVKIPHFCFNSNTLASGWAF